VVLDGGAQALAARATKPNVVKRKGPKEAFAPALLVLCQVRIGRLAQLDKMLALLVALRAV
jgi:hypothetical protein